MKNHEAIISDKRLMLAQKDPMLYSGYITLSNGHKGSIIAGRNEEGWEHVSICLYNRQPSWDEMCEVKDIFWDDEEQVVQIHPRKSQYVNITEAFHLWRPSNGDWVKMNEAESEVQE